MASNPPFHVMEDQTDQDFFDKLVDDEFGSTNSPPNFAEGSDSDEAKAFSNLNIDDNGGNGGSAFKTKGVEEFKRNDVVEGRNDNANSSNVVASDVVESDNTGGGGTEDVSDLISGKSTEPAKSGVKEVGWSLFYADSVPNGNHGFGSESDFFRDLGGELEEFPAKVEESVTAGNGDAGVLDNSVGHEVCQDGTQVYALDNSVRHEQYQDGMQIYPLDHSVSHEQCQDGTQVYGGSTEEIAQDQDLNSSQYWENVYPGWKYDANTGQWYQVDGFDATSSAMQASSDANAGNEWATVSDVKAEFSYLQQSSQSAADTVMDTGTTESVSSWNQVSQLNNKGYPEHMVFDPQYPGWYYDTIAQEWRSLESYISSAQSATMRTHDQPNQNAFDVSGLFSQSSSNMHNEYGQTDMPSSQGYSSLGHQDNWTEPYGGHNQQALKTWQQEPVAETTISRFSGNRQLKFFSNFSTTNHVGQQTAFDSFGAASYDNANFGNAEANRFVGSQNFMQSGNFGLQVNQGNLKQNEQMNFSNGYFGNQNEQTNFSNDCYGTQKAGGVSQQSFQHNLDYSHSSNAGRSSDGRPPCALVSFGFGGKLIVMKPYSALVNSSFSSQESTGDSISVLNMMEVVSNITDKASSFGGGNRDYFHPLCQQSFPGPLVGGSVGNKELNKWIDERIANCGSVDLDYRKGEVLKLLLSLLKIACQHYGKLRSSFGTDITLKESDNPESTVAKLFASVKSNGTQFREYGALSHCLHNLPSEGQIQATASEVQNLLVSGRKREALQYAQEGQLWGPALVLASQLGDQFYVDTIKQMALRQLVAGSPLRTLCLLIAGQPADVFSSEATHQVGLPGTANNSQQSAQFGANCMLDDWEENLAVITANRTKDDELVILHLGDCLWKDKSEIIAAHICYLIAEANFEAYSDSARLCLVGADHWKHPRTYASPQAIQRTELYEYSKVLGNSQFILLPFQPYKLIYAYMLAEVGKVSDSLKYCQAALKSLKTGRAPEVETWKQSVLALEERIKTHQQGGYATNLAPAKLVGKLLNFFDSTAHRVVGGLPPPAPSASQSNFQGNEQFNQSLAPRVSTSQSTMAMSSLVPSASMEPISEWAADGNRMSMHNRSVSEPDFGRTPRQVDSKEVTSSSAEGKTSGSLGGSRFGRLGFGSQLLQKTVGLVLRPRSGRQAKLGETNKFFYDEKLKRWVEEGAEPPAEEPAFAPPPTTASFQNGLSDYNLKSALKNDGSPPNGSPTFKSPAPMEHASGIPPIPAVSNQFSARGRMGVRARYVDTFNQGSGNSAKLFQSPSAPSVKPIAAYNAKFFIPAQAQSRENSVEIAGENAQVVPNAESPSTMTMNETATHSSPMSMQRFPSMANLSRKEMKVNGVGPLSSHSRRTASWSGSFGDSFSSPPSTAQPKSLGEALGIPPSAYMPSEPSVPKNRGSFVDELQEVEL